MYAPLPAVAVVAVYGPLAALVVAGRPLALAALVVAVSGRGWQSRYPL